MCTLSLLLPSLNCHCHSYTARPISLTHCPCCTDFDRVLGQYTREGLRVLALAAAEVSHLPDSALQTYSQEQLESAVALQLVGLAVMANPLRPDTAGVIDTLLKAQVRWC